MLNITIDPNLKQAWPKATLGCVQCKVVTQPSGEKLLAEIAGVETWLQSTLKIEEIKTREQIAQTRACCRALGKDVQRYRNSAEAMHRRILQGKGLYQINNVVDTGNLISIKTGYSLGAYDVEKLEGDILWTATGEGVHYQGIGKDAVNIEFLPVLRNSAVHLFLQRCRRLAAGAGRRLPRPCRLLPGAGCAGLGGGVAPCKVAFCRKMW